MKHKLLGNDRLSANRRMFFRGRLSNGVRVVGDYRPNDTATTLAFIKAIGSGDEPANLKGLNHLIEHVSFIGKEEKINKLENQGSLINAWTTLSQTGYHTRFREQDLDDNVSFLCSLLKLSPLSRKRFEAEKRVVLEEANVYHDNPAKSSSDIILPCLFNSPFGDGTLGDSSTLGRINLEVMSRYFENGLNPKDFLVSFVGNVEPRKLIRSLEGNLIAGNFIKNKDRVERVDVEEVKRHSFEVRRDLDQTHMVLGIHSPSSINRLNPATHVLDTFLTDGMSSPVYKTLTESGRVYNISEDHDCSDNYGLYSIYLSTSSDSKMIGRLIRKIFRSAQNLSKDRFDAVKDRMIASLDTFEVETEEVVGALATRELDGRGAESFFNRKREVETVSLEDFRYMARRLSDYQTAVITPGRRSKKEYKASRLF